MNTSSQDVSGYKVHCSSQKTSKFSALSVLFLLLATQAFGQAPALLWTTNVGATLFAVDDQTNTYANVGGSVIKISATGAMLSSNSICPLPGFAQRDASGNFYFGGNFDGTQNFGGITLVGGWTNWPSPGQWTPGYPTHFVAKYNSAGVLQWVKSFGQQAATGLRLTDILVDSTGAVYAGHLGLGMFPGTALVSRIGSTGAFEWGLASGSSGFDKSVKLGGLTSSNCVYNAFLSDFRLFPRRISSGGVVSNAVPFFGLMATTIDSTNAKPVIDNLGRVILAGLCNLSEPGCSGQYYLRKYALDTSTVWSVLTSPVERWVLARDSGENIYLGGTGGLFEKYDTNGNLLWTNNYSKKIVSMLVDASDNRFVGFADGSIARLGPGAPPQSPIILSDPQNQVVMLGSNATFSVSASGSPALSYQWRKDGTNLTSATSTNYTITDVTTNHVGSYDVVVTNVYGSATSTPPASLLISPSLVSPFTGTIGVWGQQATLSVSAWGSGTLTYQWYNAGQLVSGATNSTLVFPSLQITNAGLYSVVVTSQYGVVTNTPAALVVNPANISLGLYAGITIDGTIGYTYGIEYTTNLVNATWQSLTNVTLTQPVEIWVDTSVNVPTAAKRFYRVTSQ